MSLARLQARIRAKKTPLALTLAPDIGRISPKILKNFTDMFGDVPMARAEALRYHGTSLLDAAAEVLPAVVLRADAYLSQGMMGADVLSNLITAAHAKELYVLLDVNAADPAPWADYGADALTVCPYVGRDCLNVPEDCLAVAAVRTGNPSGGEVQTLLAGDRPLWLALAEQTARRGAALSVATGYSLDVRDARKRCPNAFLVLPSCDGENGAAAFDEFGHGALLTDETLQYAADPAAAIRAAAAELKTWVTVV